MTTHKFDPANAGKLDDPSRLKALPPEKLIAKIGNITGSWADIGCGTGNFTLELAKFAAEVTGIDISKTMLEILSGKIQAASVTNVHGLLSHESQIPAPDESFDGITLFFVAHEAQHLGIFLRELHRILKKGGRLVVVEFGEDSSFGPPAEHRLSPDILLKDLEESGLTFNTKWEYISNATDDGRVAKVYGVEAKKR